MEVRDARERKEGALIDARARIHRHLTLICEFNNFLVLEILNCLFKLHKQLLHRLAHRWKY